MDGVLIMSLLCCYVTSDSKPEKNFQKKTSDVDALAALAEAMMMFGNV